jgi:hypothetical protein
MDYNYSYCTLQLTTTTTTTTTTSKLHYSYNYNYTTTTAATPTATSITRTTFSTALQLLLQPQPQPQLQHYNFNNINYTTTTTTLQLQLQVQLHYTSLHHTTSCSCGWGDHFQKSQPPSVHQWSWSAIHGAQQQTSPIGFLLLNLPPPPCAALPVYVGDRYVLSLCTYTHINTINRSGAPVWLDLGFPVGPFQDVWW